MYVCKNWLGHRGTIFLINGVAQHRELSHCLALPKEPLKTKIPAGLAIGQ
jgi:hypothetical protein